MRSGIWGYPSVTFMNWLGQLEVYDQSRQFASSWPWGSNINPVEENLPGFYGI